MLNQTFVYTDLLLVLFLAGVEIMLSADNAIAIAYLASKLEEHKQAKALWIGFISGVLIRSIGILFAAFIIHLTFIQIIGALYLIYIGSSFFFKKKPKTIYPVYHSFWKTVFLIEFTDTIFAIDSILAAFALVGASTSSTVSPKLWIVYAGAIIGMACMRIAARLVLKLMKIFPKLVLVSQVLIIWIGVKMLFQASSHVFILSSSINLIFNTLFWIGCGIILIFAFKRK